MALVMTTTPNTVAYVLLYLAAVCLSVCLSIPRHIPTLLHGPDVTWENGRGCPLVVYCWADLQLVHEFCCYNNIHVCKLIALYTANAYNAEREMSANVRTHSIAG